MRECDCLRRCLLGLAFLALLAAGGCAGSSTSLPRIWIDVPASGAEIPTGTSLSVVSHVYAREGVAEVMLCVNGKAYNVGHPADMGAPFGEVTQQWVAADPGEYMLEVTAYDTGGRPSLPDAVLVTVVGEAVPTPPAPVPTATPTATTVPAVSTPTSTSAPPPVAPSPTVAPALTATPPPPAPVPSPTWPPPPTPTLPPPPAPSTPTPADTVPPAITGIMASTQGLQEPPCEPNEVRIRAGASDPSGIDTVVVMFRVVEGASEGAWRQAAMSPVGGEQYEATLGWPILATSLDPPVTTGSSLQYYVEAIDVHGNTASSGTGTVSITYCMT